MSSLPIQQVPELDVEQVTAVLHLIRWSGVAASAVVLLIAIVLLRVMDQIVERLSENFAQWRMFLNKMRAVFHFTVYLLTGMVIVMLSFRLTDQILTLLGGTAAVAIGFASKDLVASLVGGITIMADRPFQVGDRVSFGGFYGDITAIGLRSVRMQTLDDNTVTIPNSKFFTDITACGNYGQLDMMVVINFHIGTDQNVRRAREVIREIAATSRYVYLAKNIEVVATQVLIESYVAVRLMLKVYVLDTRFEKAMETDITLRVLEAFAEMGFQPPAILHRSLDSAPVPQPAE
jgi:small-conductance mechanosensitive channel